MCCIVNLKMQKFISNQMFLLQIFFTVNEVVFQVVSQFEVYLKWMSLIESIFFWWLSWILSPLSEYCLLLRYVLLQ